MKKVVLIGLLGLVQGNKGGKKARRIEVETTAAPSTRNDPSTPTGAPGPGWQADIGQYVNQTDRSGGNILVNGWEYGMSDCWPGCSSSGGLCPSVCGADGYCCSRTKPTLNGDCPLDGVSNMNNIAALPSNPFYWHQLVGSAHICARLVDFCAASPEICGFGGTCANTAGAHTCTCATGWDNVQGSNGETCVPIVQCSTGTAIGIDIFGDLDITNYENCYPTKTSAFVGSCNNPTSNVAEMTISFEKNYFDSTIQLSNFAINAAGTHYEQVIGFGGSNQRLSADGLDVELFFEISDQGKSIVSQGRLVYLASKKHVEFVCKYSMATQTVSTNVDVKGTDIQISRIARGNLIFTMTGATNVIVGERHQFSIVPTTPGAVFFKAVHCKVQPNDLSRTFELIYDPNGAGICTEPITSLTLDTGLWSSQNTQSFSYNSFKFTLPATRVVQSIEEQVITCTIELSMTTDSSYNPAACAQSSNIGQTCATFYIGKTCNSANPLTVNANTSGNIGHGTNQLRPDMNDVVECVDVAAGCLLSVYNDADQLGSAYSSPYSGSNQSVHADIDSFTCTC